MRIAILRFTEGGQRNFFHVVLYVWTNPSLSFIDQDAVKHRNSVYQV